MIDFKFDTSNDISHPEDFRKVNVLINGERFRLEIERLYEDRPYSDGRKFYSAEVTYTLYKEGIEKSIGYLIFNLVSEINHWSHKDAKRIGFDEIPDDYFVLDKIAVDEQFRRISIGTALMNRAMQNIILFNKLHGKNIKILFQRRNLNIDVTLPFYDNFGARVNSDEERYNVFKERTHGAITPMIIDEPKIVGEVPVVIDDNSDCSLIENTNHLIDN